MITYSDSLRQQLIRKLQYSTAPVSIALDGWTNVRRFKVTNIVIVSAGVAYYWTSIENTIQLNGYMSVYARYYKNWSVSKSNLCRLLR